MMPPGGKPFYGPDNLDFPSSGGLLLVRHSERPAIRTIAESYTVGITEKGKREAYHFGKQLGAKWKIREAVSSPVCRCTETCECILSGAVNNTSQRPPVRPMNALHFDQKLTGLGGLSQVFLDDDGFTKLITNPESCEYAFMRQNLLNELPVPVEDGVLNVAVTHDVIVTFLQACLMGLPSATIHDYPGFLEGILLIRDEGQIRLG